MTCIKINEMEDVFLKIISVQGHPITFLTKLIKEFEKTETKRCFIFLSRMKETALKHEQSNKDFVMKVFKACEFILILLTQVQNCKSKIACIQELKQKVTWSHLIDRFSTCTEETLTTLLLLKHVIKETISSHSKSTFFLEDKCRVLSKIMVLPKVLSRTPEYEEKTEIYSGTHQYPEGVLQERIDMIVTKWDKEFQKQDNKPLKNFKTLKIKIYPTRVQKEHLNNIIDVYRYVYNRTLYFIKYKDYYPNFMTLRDFLVTEETRKLSPEYSGLKKKQTLLEKELKASPEQKLSLKPQIEEFKKAIKKIVLENPRVILPFEKTVGKNIRANAVKSICDAYKSAKANLKAGNIKYFDMKFKKKSEPCQTIELDKQDISKVGSCFKMCPTRLKEDAFFKMSPKNAKKYKNLVINNNCDLVRRYSEYWIYVTIPYEYTIEVPKKIKICSIDPGVRKFMNVYDLTNIIKYETNPRIFKETSIINGFKKRKKVRKKHYIRHEKHKKNYIDNMHWCVINKLVKEFSIILFGDIKSHSIVKNGKNSKLNSNMNDLKFYQFKQRLAYKAQKNNVKVIFVPEDYSTQACSDCGNLHKKIGSSGVFTCPTCKFKTCRDTNSTKNIFVKGLLL